MARKKTKVQQNAFPRPSRVSGVRNFDLTGRPQKPPARVELTLGSIKLPPGSKVDLVQVRGSRDLYQVRAAVRGSELGRRLNTITIATERINRKSLEGIDLASLKFEGRRPEYSRIDHMPGKVALKRSDVPGPRRSGGS